MRYDGADIVDYSEKNLIDQIRKIVEPNSDNLLDGNEDAVAFYSNNMMLIVNVDAWVASTDKIPGYSYFDCGFRATLNSISDVITKSGTPKFLLASIGIEYEQRENVIDIVKGIKSACNKYNIAYLGGDLNQSNDTFIDITVIGESLRITRRNNAKVGEDVYWLGPKLGENTAAFGILLKSWIGDKSRALDILKQPKLYPEFIELNASSSIDCSDGLAKSLHILAESSNVGIEFLVPNEISTFVKQASIDNHKDIIDLLMFGGEELGIIFTTTSNYTLPSSCELIGKVVEGSGVHYNGTPIPNIGWDHFNTT